MGASGKLGSIRARRCSPSTRSSITPSLTTGEGNGIMANGAPCPKLDDLQRFLLGRLSEADAERLQQHLAGCPQCQGALQNLEGHDTLLEAMRAQGKAAARSEDAVVESLVALLSGLHAPTPQAAGP